MIADPFVPFQSKRAVAAARSRHDAAVNQRDVTEIQIKRRKGFVQLGDERIDFDGGGLCSTRFRRLLRLPRSKERAASPWHEKQVTSRCRARAQRLLSSRPSGNEVHRLDERHPGRKPQRFQQAIHRGARGIDGEAGCNLEFPPCLVVARSYAGHALAFGQ